MKNISIKWKIFIFLIGFCGLLLCILWLFQVVFLDSFYKHIKINEVRNSASEIVKNIDNEIFPLLVEEISVSNDVCIEVLMENGGALYSSDILKNCTIHKMSAFEKMRLLIRTIENGGELLEYYMIDTDIYPKQSKFNLGEETIIFSKIMTNKNNKIVQVMINSVVSPVNSTVTTLRIQLYYITGFMLVFSAVLALIISKHVSKPIEKINESAKSLAVGDYNTIFSGSGYREIKELSDTLNHTAKELSKVENLRRELIANISHDLRTPLTLIGGYAEAMNDLPDEMNSQNAQIIVDETKRLTSLVNDMLDLSKSQSGTGQLNLQSYNITNSIMSNINRMNELVKKDGYTVNFNCDKEIYVVADETKISQAFYNILINAINYTGSEKIVTVNQISTENSVRIEVVDTGEGISSENLPYIWDRYFKENKIHKRAVTGTGLGLSIVKSIIEQHCGEYGVHSTVSEGSTFWFSLKLMNAVK